MASGNPKDPRGGFRWEGGFTLLEVLISVVILTVALLGMAALSVGIMRGNDLSERITLATTLAQDSMEDVVRRGFNNTPDTATTVTEDYGTIAGFPPFKRLTTVEPASSLIPQMKKVVVTVYWDQDKHQVKLDSFIGR